jgi:DNA polymerase-1
MGRKRHLWDIDSQEQGIRGEAERQAINSPVQSMASDMMLLSLVKLHAKLDPTVVKIIGSVHDSILFEIRDEAVDDVLPGIIETMETLPLEEEFGCLLTVPIKVDAKVGRFWSEGSVDYEGS